MNQEFTDVAADFMFESPKKEYVPAPTKELLKFVVAPLEMTEQINNFKTLPNGDDNPEFGKPQPVLVFKAELYGNGIEADGQVYSTWITGYYKDGKPKFSMGDRSKLGKLAEAISGSVEAFQATAAGLLVGSPFQCALVPGKKDPNRLLLDVDKAMPPAKGQARKDTVASIDALPTDDELENQLVDAVNAV